MKVTDDGIPTDSLINTVKSAIKAAGISSTDDGRRLRVTAVQLNLNAVATITTGAKVELKIPFIGMTLKFGGSVTAKDTHIIDITLVPADFGAQHEIRDGDVDDVLVGAIETIGAVMANAAGGDDPFVLKDSSVELSFAITREGTISLVGEGATKDEVTHKLKVSLEMPKP